MSRFVPRTRPVEREDFPERPWTAQDEAEHRAETCMCGHDSAYHDGVGRLHDGPCGAAATGSGGLLACECEAFESIQPL